MADAYAAIDRAVTAVGAQDVHIADATPQQLAVREARGYLVRVRAMVDPEWWAAG